MTGERRRAHGVTPGLRRDYVDRTAERQAAFVLPHLRPGMDLLDLGCGPGTITVGLARAVAPGRVTGIDHDATHVEAARALAAAEGVHNVSFRLGDALALPFEDGVFDAVFENNLFTHLAANAGAAAREARRVLEEGGFLAARDTEADAVVWGHHTEAIAAFDALFHRWQRSRGSDITLGKRLPEILRAAGFTDTVKSVSADTKGTPAATGAHAAIMLQLLEGPLGRDALEHGWAEPGDLERLAAPIRAWGAHPDAFFSNVHVEVVGWSRPRS